MTNWFIEVNFVDMKSIINGWHRQTEGLGCMETNFLKREWRKIFSGRGGRRRMADFTFWILSCVQLLFFCCCWKSKFNIEVWTFLSPVCTKKPPFGLAHWILIKLWVTQWTKERFPNFTQWVLHVCTAYINVILYFRLKF